MGSKILNLPQFNIGKFLLFIVSTFIVIALLNLMLGTLFPEKTFFTEPSIPLLFFVVIAAGIFPFIAFINDGKLNRKDVAGLILYAAIILVILAFLPSEFPEFFGKDFVLSDFIKSLDLFKSTIGLP